MILEKSRKHETNRRTKKIANKDNPEVDKYFEFVLRRT